MNRVKAHPQSLHIVTINKIFILISKLFSSGVARRRVAAIVSLTVTLYRSQNIIHKPAISYE